MSEELQPVFSVERLYVKDLSLEVPHAPQIFLEQGEPEVDMRVSTGNTKLEDGFYSVDVTVTVTAKLNEERTMFLNEVTQSGIFRLETFLKKTYNCCWALLVRTSCSLTHAKPFPTA